MNLEPEVICFNTNREKHTECVCWFFTFIWIILKFFVQVQGWAEWKWLTYFSIQWTVYIRDCWQSNKVLRAFSEQDIVRKKCIKMQLLVLFQFEKVLKIIWNVRYLLHWYNAFTRFTMVINRSPIETKPQKRALHIEG